MGPITAPLSLSFITQFVCTLIRGLALPAHPSNTHRHTGAHIYTHVCPLTVSTLPSWTLRHMHTYILLRVCMSPHTLISTPTYAALTTHTYTCSSNGEFSHASFFLSHHSIIVICSLALFVPALPFSFCGHFPPSHKSP